MVAVLFFPLFSSWVSLARFIISFLGVRFCRGYRSFVYLWIVGSGVVFGMVGGGGAAVGF